MDVVHAKAAVFDHAGGADVIELRSVAVPAPQDGEVRVRINAIGLNRSEAMFREGWHPVQPDFPSRLGYEAAGVVESIGAGVTRFAAGDRVSTLPIMELNARGAYGEMFTVPAALVVESPPELSDEETAALWSSYMTAYGMVVELVKIEAGDWILVTAASSSLGPPIMQILAQLGARVIATTRGREKAEAIRAMGAEHVVVTGDEDLAERVMAITGGRGVRFVFDPVAGPLVETLAQVTQPYGAIVLYGVLDFEAAPLPIMPVIGKNLSIIGYAMMLEDQPERNERAIAFIREGVRAGTLKPLLGKRFPLDEIRNAARYFDSMQQIGKIIVVPDRPAN
jgi:NADPH:quinone reductase-like Zn-dependent oxidoreductase